MEMTGKERGRRFAKALLAAAALLMMAAWGGGCARGEKTIVLTFTGDCTIGSTEQKRNLPDSFDTVVKEKGYAWPFAKYRDLFEKDDCTVINFEGVLSNSKEEENTKKVYRFRGPTDFVNVLLEGSVEAAGLSNNHTKDFGSQGLRNTSETLTAAGIPWFRLRDTYVFRKDGIGVALIAIDNSSLQNNGKWLKEEMRRLKASGEAGAIVVCFHCGTEYDAKHNENQRLRGEWFLKNGADLVIMNHPHVPQGIRVYKNRTVCYSLGNFVFGGNSQIRTETLRNNLQVTSLYALVVQAELRFDDDGTYLGQQITLYPTFTSSEAPVNNYQPYPVSGEEAEAVRAAVQLDTDFDLPPLTEENGYTVMKMHWLPANDR